MKKITTLLVLAALLALSISVASAAPSSYSTGFQVANLSSSATANISMSFYNASGGNAIEVTDTIAAGSSNTYFPLSNPDAVNLPAGFAGSAVISSDQPVAAIVNVLGDGTSGASAVSFDGGSTTVSLPLIAKNQVNIYSTWFHVQNVGTAATNVTVAYAGTACTETQTGIQPGAAAKFDQATNTCLTNGHVGAATITSSAEPIVATVIETSANDTGLFAYNGFTGGSTTVAMPLAQFNNAGYHSGMQIQNIGNAATTVTVNYAPAGGVGTACTETGSIEPGASKTFGLSAFSIAFPAGTTTTCTFGQKFVGSATATADQAMVAIINQTNLSQYASAYNGFNPASATTTVNMPLIMDRNSGFFTGFNVQNVGDASTDVTCTFSGSAVTVEATLAAGEALNDLQLNKLANGYVGSATCTSTGEPLLAVVNELNLAASTDFLFTYEGVNQ